MIRPISCATGQTSIIFILLSILVVPIEAQNIRHSQSHYPDFKMIESAMYEVDLQHRRGGVSSLLLVKPDGNNNYKLVFITQFGLKLIEIYLQPNGMEVIQCQDWMDRRIFLNIIRKDLEALFYTKLSDDDITKWQSGKPVRKKKYKYYLEQDVAHPQVSRIEIRNRFISELTAYFGTIPQKISMKHRGIGPAIRMELIESSPKDQ